MNSLMAEWIIEPHLTWLPTQSPEPFEVATLACVSSVLESRLTIGWPADAGSNNSGYYQLQAVLTHQGRSSSSGHYVGWVKLSAGWIKFDDDVVTPVTEEDVLRLSGGGDWHCAYVLLYGPRRLPEGVLPPEPAPAAAAASAAETEAESMEQ